MICRHGRVLPVLVLGLLAFAGCTRWQSCLQQSMVAEHPVRPSAGSGDLTPTQAAQLCLMAGDALEKKGLAAEAIRQYENARKQDPQAPGVARRLAVLYDLQGDTASAEREYQRARQEQPRDADLLNDFGYFHYRHNHLKLAESWLHIAIKVNPQCACAWNNLGQVLACQGRAEESYRAFAHVLRPAEAYSNVGILLAKQGLTGEARKALQQAVKLDPSLQQPRAFLTALGNVPEPLPPGLTHKSEPVRQMPAAKPSRLVPSPASNLVSKVEAIAPAEPQPLPMEWTPPKRNRAVPASTPSPAVSSRSTKSPAKLPNLPVIVNAPLQPVPISTRRAPVKSTEKSSSPKTSMAPRQPLPLLHPPAPPSPPPLAVLASGGSTEEPTIIRTSAFTEQRKVPPTHQTVSLPEQMPSVIPSPRDTEPQAVLIDCQIEREPEHEQ